MLDHLGTTKRTHSCGELRLTDAGQTVTLMGWVNRRRDHGPLIFIHLRDRDGITQIVLNEENAPEAHARAKKLAANMSLGDGTCVARSKETINSNMETGEVGIVATEVKILNDAKTPPFQSPLTTAATEDMRLKYRYLDLRRPEMQRHLRLPQARAATRAYLDQPGFYEIETPILTKSTPEGARRPRAEPHIPGRFFAFRSRRSSSSGCASRRL
jgi:aspartyl-tRNA synthetase